MKTRLSLEDVLSHPIAQALDPRGKHFLSGRLLSHQLNPYQREGISITALLAFGGPFLHLKVIPAFQMMLEEFQAGRYEGKHTIVVDSSGNTAQAVSRLALAFGFSDVKVVMSVDVPAPKRDIFSAMASVEIIQVSKGGSVAARAIEEAKKSGHVHLNQYAHLGNARSHEFFTGPEIARVLDNDVGIVAIAMGSGGTAAGVARYLRRKFPRATLVGVRPVLGQQVPGARDKEKMRSVVPPACLPQLDHVVDVSRKDSFVAMRRLWSEVEPQPGPTSGLAYVGLLKYLEYIASTPCALQLLGGGGRKAAFVCPDSAMLYSGVISAELDPGQGL